MPWNQLFGLRVYLPSFVPLKRTLILRKMDILNSSWLVYFSTPNKCEKSPFCLQITVEWGVVTKVIYYWCADECRLITPLEKKLSVIYFNCWDMLQKYFDIFMSRKLIWSILLTSHWITFSVWIYENITTWYYHKIDINRQLGWNIFFIKKLFPQQFCYQHELV